MSEKTKKVSYANLLKEALSDFTEVPKNVDTVGPFLDPILSYKGDGELPTHKDAASILERYYFQQDQDDGVTVAVEEDVETIEEEESVVKKDIVTVGKDKAALPEVPETVKSSKDDTEKAMAMEQAEEEMVADEEEEEAEEVEEQIVPEEPAGLAGDEKELPPRKGKDAENQVKAAQLEADDSVESAVIEKLISEMEEDDEDEEEQGGDEESVKGPVAEQEEEEEEEEKEELDVDKEMEDEEEKEEEEEVEEQAAPSAVPGGPSPKKTGEDYDDVEEAFNIFKEQIEDDDVPEVDSEEVVV